MVTVWKNIPGYEGKYQASEFGMVRSTNRIVKKGNKKVPSKVSGQLISPYVGTDGYLRVDMSRNGNRRHEKLHSIIAKTFIPNPDNKETVNHIDENKLNNTVSNLEWMTNAENVNYGTRIQRVKEKYGTKVIRISPSKHVESFATLHDAEQKTGILRQSIAYAIKNKTKLKGYEWEEIL